MVKKITKYTLILAVILILTLLLVLNYQRFPVITNRLLEIKDISNLQNIFEKYLSKNTTIYEDSMNEIIDNANNILENIKKTKPLKVVILNILEKTILFTIDFINYFLNIGINLLILLMIYYHETFSGTNLKIKYSLPAKLYIKISILKDKLIRAISHVLKLTIRQLSKNRRVIALILGLTLLANGILYKILVELVIFIVSYVYHAFKLETYIVLSSMGKASLIFIFPKLKYIPVLPIIPIILLLIFLRAISKAEKRLTLNHRRLKDFAKNTLTQTTFINGLPGTGKTLLNLSLTLAHEENFIDLLEEKLLEYELKYPYLNFAKIRNNPSNYPKHKEYIFYYDYLNTRKSFIISNYAIYSPYFNDYSKIFDFNFTRKNLTTNIYALEEYIVISLSEIDKEWNAHDSMKEVGADGVATFFSTISHDLKRQVKITCDYQLKDQVPLRIRGNAEYFYKVEKRLKKYPFVLGLYYAPFRITAKLVRKLIIKYETKKPYINRKTKRSTVAIYKRNDFTLLYAILRQLANTLNKIANFFDHYWYFKLKGTLSEEDTTTTGKKQNIYLNICDLSINNMALYDSTFLSYAYEEKKNKAFKDLETFTTLRPSTAELTKCHSRFYDKINGINNK